MRRMTKLLREASKSFAFGYQKIAPARSQEHKDYVSYVNEGHTRALTEKARYGGTQRSHFAGHK